MADGLSHVSPFLPWFTCAIAIGRCICPDIAGIAGTTLPDCRSRDAPSAARRSIPPPPGRRASPKRRHSAYSVPYHAPLSATLTQINQSRRPVVINPCSAGACPRRASCSGDATHKGWRYTWLGAITQTPSIVRERRDARLKIPGKVREGATDGRGGVCPYRRTI